LKSRFEAGAFTLKVSTCTTQAQEQQEQNEPIAEATYNYTLFGLELE